MIYINNTHKQGQPTTVVENKNAQNVQNKEKEINMRQEENKRYFNLVEKYEGIWTIQAGSYDKDDVLNELDFMLDNDDTLKESDFKIIETSDDVQSVEKAVSELNNTKEKEINMTSNKLDTIEMKENERMEIKLPCGAIIDVFNSDNGAIIDVSHFRTKYNDEVKIKSFGRFSPKNTEHSWTEARTEFREDNQYVLVSHIAHNK
tara:strand:+ start:238 stop:849 length:612 start_codon:yes stop_codon:yes gene_type:complete